MHDGLNQLVTATVLFLPRLAVSIATFLGFWVAAAVLQAVVARVGGRSYLGDDVRRLIQRVLKVGVLTFGAVTALGTTPRSRLRVSAFSFPTRPCSPTRSASWRRRRSRLRGAA